MEIVLIGNRVFVVFDCSFNFGGGNSKGAYGIEEVLNVGVFGIDFEAYKGFGWHGGFSSASQGVGWVIRANGWRYVMHRFDDGGVD